MKKQSVSVIIPVYNEEKYILRCLDSLVSQTLTPLEVTVVDDGSIDSSKLKISAFTKFTTDWQNFVLLEQKHQGPGAARNLGARKAKGEILVFVDADMYFDRRYLENLVKPILEGKAVATFTREEYVANPENIWSKCWSIQSSWPIDLHIDPDIPNEANNFRAILKRVFLQTYGYRNVGYGEDVTVLTQLNGIKAKAAQGAKCYHFNPSNLQEVFNSARWMGRGESFRRNLTAILTFSFPNSIRKGTFESFKNKTPRFLLFKLTFDLGMFLGILERRILGIHRK